MSHKATAWAITAQNGRGLSAAAKIVLWHLADRHNPDNGCFPSQGLLANDAEVSRSQLNVHLGALERAGLIRRMRCFDEKTHKKLPTRYLFAFEAEFEALPTDADLPETDQPDLPLEAEPCPEIGHGAMSGNEAKPCPIEQQSHVRPTGHKPVIEPVRESFVRSVDEAEVDRAFAEFWSVHPRPSQRDASRQLFREAVHAGEEAREIVSAARRYAKDQTGNKAMYVCRSDNWLKGKRWRETAGPHAQPGADAGGVAEFWAPRVKEGRYIAPNAFTLTVAREMVQRGLVDRTDLAKVGVRL